MIPEKAQLPIFFTATVTEVGVALRAGHVITAIYPLDVDLKEDEEQIELDFWPGLFMIVLMALSN